MGLAFKSGLAIFFLFGLIYALVFAIGIYAEWPWWIMVLVAGAIVFFQYLIGPVIISWIYRIDWIPADDLDRYFPHLAQIVDKVVEMRGIKRPKMGIIHDLNPNAFCYGWSKNTARIVITEGISEYCNEKEQQAVLAHELGHVVHSDFIVMTIVFAIPLILLTIARSLYWSARFSSLRKSSDSDNAQYLQLALYVIAALSYVAYWIGYMISLLVSRIREYYADEFSAEVLENPNPLSTALVKIAYGLLISSDNEKLAKSRVRGTKGLGIFDASKAKAFSAMSRGPSGKYSKEAVQAAAAWDLYNPWAKYFQLFSTHPLPAKRIMALNEMCNTKFELKPEIDLSKAKEIRKKQAGSTMLDEFLVDVTIKALPSILFVLLVILSVLMVLGGVFPEVFPYLAFFSGITLNQLILLWGIGFFIIGFGHIARTAFMYKSSYKPETVIDLVTNIKVSPVRCVPAVIEGHIVGRGVPGYYFSEDLFFQDKTGLMYIDYKSGFRLVDFIFALWGAKKLMDKPVRIRGWYRRGPSPFLQVDRIEDLTTGKIRKNYAKFVTYLWAVLSFGVGALIFWLWTQLPVMTF